MSKYAFILLLIIISVGGATLAVNMKDVPRSMYIEQFSIKSQEVGNVIVDSGKKAIDKILTVVEDASEFIKSPVEKVEQEVNDFFTSNFKMIDGTPIETYEYEQLNGFEKAWYWIKNTDWWPFW